MSRLNRIARAGVGRAVCAGYDCRFMDGVGRDVTTAAMVVSLFRGLSALAAMAVLMSAAAPWWSTRVVAQTRTDASVSDRPSPGVSADEAARISHRDGAVDASKGAKTTDVLVPKRPENVVAAKAYGTLERNCAGCHQAGVRPAGMVAGGLANILNLNEIARDGSLVRPGVADASILYNSILSNRMPPGLTDSLSEPPSGEEVQALRDWINELPVSAGQGCSQHASIKTADVHRAVKMALRGVSAEKAGQLRFLSFANLIGDCISSETLEGLRQGVLRVLAAVGGRTESLTVKLIGPQKSVLQFDLKQNGWLALQWDFIVESDQLRDAPAYKFDDETRYRAKTGSPLLAADRFAEAAIETEIRNWLRELAVKGDESDAAFQRMLPATFSDIVAQDRARIAKWLTGLGLDPRPRVWGLPPLAALLRIYRRPLNLARAAADYGVSVAEMRRRVSVWKGEGEIAARLLMQGVAPRPFVESMLAAFDGNGSQSDEVDDGQRADEDPTVAEVPPGDVQQKLAAQTVAIDEARASRLLAKKPFVLAVWGDKPRYQVGDYATFYAQASEDCFLTLVSVDQRKRALVLFPNNFQRDNRLRMGTVMRVPTQDAGYRVRLEQAGRETIVGICSKTDKAPDGIVHDFDRLRFTVLGDWQIFLRDPPRLSEARRDDAATSVPRPVRRRGRGKTNSAEIDEVDVQARHAFVIDIAPVSASARGTAKK